MTAKEYLQQGYRLDQRINSKIAQVTNLRELATKATATLSDMPGNATPNTHRMEDIIVKMVVSGGCTPAATATGCSRKGSKQKD